MDINGETALDSKLSCDDFPSDTTSSSQSGPDFKCNATRRIPKKDNLPPGPEESCLNVFSTSTSSSSSVSTGFFNAECQLHRTNRKEPPNIGYEMSIAKSILQQYSTLSGDNLFDHLSDIIKRVIDERPPNIIDFFEEFSRNVREQKFHLPERFPPESIYEESRLYRVAKKTLLSMQLPMTEEQNDLGEEMSMESLQAKPTYADDLNLDLHNDRLFKTFNERVQQLQFYWNQCGFSITLDDIFQLACSMNRLQVHPSILQCRFWGVVNGLKASYYVVEATLTQEEVQRRLEQMECEMREKQQASVAVQCGLVPKEKTLPSHIGPELTPGIFGWENFPETELAQMQPPVVDVPLVAEIEVFDIPPEPIGKGLNRFSYFVVNALCDDWIELPIVTPKQIVISRHIKKFLTGDLEADVRSYPCFPGKEKHYLRAMIARITAGTHIAPRDYYRKMTKKEKRLYDGLDDGENEEEEEEEELGEEDDDEVDNDVILLRNEGYEPLPLSTMGPAAQWLHVRPYILNQGRIVWFDELKARKEREAECARLLRLQAEEGEEEAEEEIDEEEMEADGEEEEFEELNPPEVGPSILTPCNEDTTEEFTVPWIPRYTSKFTNEKERVLVMRSNIWPGAFTFLFEKVCESVYMGWGHKYTSRNMPFKHLPPVLNEFEHGPGDFIEAIDPSVADEEAYRLYLMRKLMQPDDGAENLSEYDENEEKDDISVLDK